MEEEIHRVFMDVVSHIMSQKHRVANHTRVIIDQIKSYLLFIQIEIKMCVLKCGHTRFSSLLNWKIIIIIILYFTRNLRLLGNHNWNLLDKWTNALNKIYFQRNSYCVENLFDLFMLVSGDKIEVLNLNWSSTFIGDIHTYHSHTKK